MSRCKITFPKCCVISWADEILIIKQVNKQKSQETNQDIFIIENIVTK